MGVKREAGLLSCRSFLITFSRAFEPCHWRPDPQRPPGACGQPRSNSVEPRQADCTDSRARIRVKSGPFIPNKSNSWDEFKRFAGLLALNNALNRRCTP